MMKLHKLLIGLVLLIGLTYMNHLQAQVTIGSNNEPNNATLLDIKEFEPTTAGGVNSQKGLGLPRVQLLSIIMNDGETNLATTIKNATGNWDEEAHVGLLVFNTADNPTCGIFENKPYVWNGSLWISLGKTDTAPYIPGTEASDRAALKQLYDANPENTLGWDFSESNTTNTFSGVTWTAGICGQRRVTILNISSKKLTSTAGIGKLTELTFLYCDTNGFTDLDVTKNTKLRRLDCYTNQLTTLDVTKNKDLQVLRCAYNSLTTLDLTKNAELTSLYCYANNLTALDVTKNTKLVTLECGVNPIASLDVTKNTKLTGLSTIRTPLTSLDLTNNTELESLKCIENQLTSLDLTKNTKLKRLDCYTNQLTSLDLTRNTELATLWCHENQLDQTSINGIGSLTKYCNGSTVNSNFKVSPQYTPGTTNTNNSIVYPTCPR